MGAHPTPPPATDDVRPDPAQSGQVVDRVDQVIFQMDTACRWTFLNRAWQHLSGYDVDASLGQPLVDFLHPDDRQAAEQLCGELVAGCRDGCEQDLRLLTRGGSTRWTAVHARPLLEAGVCVGVAGTLSDVTTRRHVQQDLERARVEAEHASAAKSEFLRSMSHEMRTPLNGVLGVLELLAATRLDPQQARYVAAARTSGVQLATLISDVLDLSRLDSGAIAVERNLFDLPHLIESSLDVVTSEAALKGLPLSCAVTPDVPRWVVGDPGRLRQVLVILLANAVKFTERGQVHVQAATRVGDLPRQVVLHVDVIDTGIGMPAELIARLFQPPSTGDVVGTRRHGGTGLGLTICKRLVDAMQGQIEAQGVEGGGTTFTVSLPIDVADAAMVESQRRGEPAPRASRSGRVTPPAWWSGLRVLVAEDHDINQMVVREMLNTMGLAADLVGDGAAAVEAALAVPYDVVIMDCQMPVLDGMDATRRIRQAHTDGRTSHSPRIIALTANATAESRRACLEAGMDAYLTKPVRSVVLQRTLARLLTDTAAAGDDVGLDLPWLDAEPDPGSEAEPELEPEPDPGAEPAAALEDAPAPAPAPAPGAAAAPPTPTPQRRHVPPPDAEDILDPEEVLLRCNGNGDLGARMLELFAASLPAELELLEAAAAVGDTEQVGRIAHKVRGAAATLAAVRLAGAIAGVELFLEHGDDGPLADRAGRRASRECAVARRRAANRPPPDARHPPAPRLSPLIPIRIDGVVAVR